MTFDPKTLTQEERALWDSLAIQERRNRRVASESYSETEGAFRDLLKARRALFGESASGGKVEKPYFCGWCRSPLSDNETHLRRILNPGGVGGGYTEYTCQPAGFRIGAASAPAKVECPNCRPFGELGGCTYCPDHLPQYRQQPAQPEPVAFGKKLVSAETHPDLFPWVKPHAQMRDEAVAEATKTEPVAAELVTSEANGYTLEWSPLDLPQEVREAAVSLRMAKLVAIRSGRHIDARNHSDAADALESFWRAHAAQPANTEKIRQDGFDDGYLAGRTYERTFAHPAPAVAMTPELERCLRECESCVQSVRDNLFGKDALADAAELEQAIAAVRSQAAEAGKVRMPKVRAIMNRLWSATGPEISDDQITAALAELNAAEGRK